MDAKIEAVSIEDAEELLDIYAYYVENTAITFEYAVPTLEEFRERIFRISKKYPYIKAVANDGTILGYAYADTFKERSAYDWSVETTIYIRRGSLRSGIGTALYQALEGLLKGMGILNMNACIAVTTKDDVHLSNASMYFHERFGFTLVGTFHDSGYKFNTWYDMVWMEKSIGEHATMQLPVAFGSWKNIR